MTTIKNLAKILAKKDQSLDVEYVVITKDGNIVCMDITANATSLIKVLKHFPQGKEKGSSND